jgi:hypothetical protein
MKKNLFFAFALCLAPFAAPLAAEDGGDAAKESRDFQAESLKSCQAELTQNGVDSAKAAAYCRCYIDQVAQTLSPADIEAMDAAQKAEDASALLGEQKMAKLRESATQCLFLLK